MKWCWHALGEGSTSQGEFWEAINTASNQKLPVIFCVEDNGYAISVPVEVNTPGGNISRLVANFPNFHFAEIDGTDAEASLRRFKLQRRIAAPAWGLHLCTATACGFTPTRSRTTTSFTARLPSARPTRCAIRLPNADAAAARGHSDRRADQDLEQSHSTLRPPRPPSARWKRRCPSGGNYHARLLRGSGSDARAFATERPEFGGKAGGAKAARRAPWPT
jgi:hypothetical protein